MKVELDLCNYVTKIDLKKVKVVNTSDFAKKVDLDNLKSEVDKLDIDKLKTTPFGWSKLSNVVKNEVVIKTVFNELVKNVNAIQTTDTTNFA